MTPERWQRVESLVRAALERPAAERNDFLTEGCAGDEELRRKAESLLSFRVRAEAEDFAGGALGEAANGSPNTTRAETLAGHMLGQYRVEREIGRGGMGEVYLARDTRLDRPVALKLLPPFLTSDADRVRRFEREARAASSLNHPNIITVHEFGEADGLRLIVTEYVEGRTLRGLIEAGELKLGQALDTAIQIASALAAAHRVGVVHRDVKPENVMVREDGYIKVLDFGLAKPTAKPQPAPLARPGDTAPTMLVTDPGMIMGTASYMSPEQTHGSEVDGRSDIFSLGIVLYEMVTGHKPFQGETISHTIVAILEREPAPLSQYAPEAPPELQQIVWKALRKNPAERYQTMDEMLSELRELREEVTFRARQEMHLSNSGASAGAARRNVAAQGRPRHGWGRAALWALALSVVVFSALAFVVHQYVTSRRAASSPPPSVKMSRITANGKIRAVAISRDGRHVAYAAGPIKQQGVWVMQTGTGSGVQIVPPAEGVGYEGLTFSPDGDYIYYIRKVGNSLSELYNVPTLGGTPKRLLMNLDSAVEFSPDGRQIAFVRNLQGSDPLGETNLTVANADGTGERVVATRKSPAYFGHSLVQKIAWSPDGKYIACPGGNADGPGGLRSELIAVSLKDGSERPLTKQKWFYIKQAAWLRDGSGLVILGRDQPTAVSQVWHLSYPGGELRRLSNDFSSYDDVSVTADSSTIVTVQGDRLSNIWVAPDADAARARQIGDSRDDGFQGVTWTPDGRVVFTSKVGGNTNIWIMDADGSNRKRLTDSASIDAYPSVSADGRYVVFESDRGDGLSIWRVDIDGGTPFRLTEGNGAGYPYCSPDGRWVYYSAVGAGQNVRTLWRVPIEGGDPVRVLDKTGALMGISPDGKWLAYAYIDPQAKPQQGVAVIPAEGGTPVNLLDMPVDRLLRWMPDGRALAYIDHRNQNVWAQPLDGGTPRQLTDFKTDQTFSFAWSRDGKLLALARGTQTSDVVMITDFK
jgi:serine/threonine protein kinase/Tol biopolymer transport system component